MHELRMLRFYQESCHGVSCFRLAAVRHFALSALEIALEVLLARRRVAFGSREFFPRHLSVLVLVLLVHQLRR